MPNPKRKHTGSRRDKRRANWRLTAATTSVCPRCGARKLPHRVCPACGFYKEELVLVKKDKKTKEKGK